MQTSTLKKVWAIYPGGYLTGLVLVLFPASGSILTGTTHHGFTTGQFGSIFTPQIILAIASSLLASKLAGKIGMKKVMLLGLLGLVISSGLLALSHIFTSNLAVSYPMILAATGFLGIGFGFTLTALNPFAYQLFPGKEASALTALHFFLGMGTATSPLLISFFDSKGYWWMGPLVSMLLVLILLIYSFTLPLKLADENKPVTASIKFTMPKRLWLYIVGVFFYGACEATFGSWGQIFLEKEGGLSIGKASLGLSLFWGFVALGRIAFTLLALRFKTNWLYLTAPWLVAVLFYFTPMAQSEFTYLAAMSLGGLFTSFLFPKSVSNSTDEFPGQSALVSGFMVAALQLGTGFSANFIGYLNQTYSLGTLFRFSALYALLFGGIIILLTTKGKSLPSKSKN